jgi:hypothetical protein
LEALKLALVPLNSTLSGVVPLGTENTTQPLLHWPAASAAELPPSCDRGANGPPNWAALAEKLTDAVDSLDRTTEKSVGFGPVEDPPVPAHSVATIASQTCPELGVKAKLLVSVTPGYQAETCTLEIPSKVSGTFTVVPKA